MEITVGEAFIIQLYLGSVIYLIGAGVRVWLGHKVIKSKLYLTLLMLLAFAVSVGFSLLILYFSPLRRDFMFGEFMNIPALLSEVFLLVIQWIIQKVYVRRYA
jgi:uncharacterized membrane protein (DUF485 family)